MLYLNASSSSVTRYYSRLTEFLYIVSNCINFVETTDTEGAKVQLAPLSIELRLHIALSYNVFVTSQFSVITSVFLRFSKIVPRKSCGDCWSNTCDRLVILSDAQPVVSEHFIIPQILLLHSTYLGMQSIYWNRN